MDDLNLEFVAARQHDDGNDDIQYTINNKKNGSQQTEMLNFLHGMSTE